MTTTYNHEILTARDPVPRAWIVSDSEEERATVIYARNPMEARRLGHGQDDVGCMDHEIDLHVRRAPEFDECRTIEDERRVQLDTGWHFQCSYLECEKRIQGYVVEGEDEYGDTVEWDGLEPVIRGSDVYCSEWHAGAEAVRHVERRVATWEAVEKAVLRFPGITVDDVWPNSIVRRDGKSVTEPMVWFRYPGGTSRIGWHPGDTTVMVPWNEIPVWEQAFGIPVSHVEVPG